MEHEAENSCFHSPLATDPGWVFDEEGNLVAMGTGAFRIFEKKGNPIV